MNSPDFRFENKHWKNDQIVVGIDEVGRGALAGPVVAGAVAFTAGKNEITSVGINDSKKLSGKKRGELACFIKQNCLFWGVGAVSNKFIDSKGIVWAIKKAMDIAVAGITDQDPVFIKDGFDIPRGDQKSISIAAASIVAKVCRDRAMVNFSNVFSDYDWESNKGYGTKFHKEAIRKHGICRLHRKSFLKNYLTNRSRS